MSDLKENGMSIGEVLAAVNKIHNQKSRNLKNFPSFKIKPLTLLIKLLRLSIDQGNKMNGPEPGCA
jgi:hypothetical protein